MVSIIDNSCFFVITDCLCWYGNWLSCLGLALRQFRPQKCELKFVVWFWHMCSSTSTLGNNQSCTVFFWSHWLAINSGLVVLMCFVLVVYYLLRLLLAHQVSATLINFYSMSRLEIYYDCCITYASIIHSSKTKSQSIVGIIHWTNKMNIQLVLICKPLFSHWKQVNIHVQCNYKSYKNKM